MQIETEAAGGRNVHIFSGRRSALPDHLDRWGNLLVLIRPSMFDRDILNLLVRSSSRARSFEPVNGKSVSPCAVRDLYFFTTDNRRLFHQVRSSACSGPMINPLLNALQ
jgi:hypothetical protein